MDQTLPRFFKERCYEGDNQRVQQEQISQVLVDLDAELNDPLRAIAERILLLTFEQAMRMADGMNKPEMAVHLARWARCYVDRIEMPNEELILDRMADLLRQLDQPPHKTGFVSRPMDFGA
jgi:hypothetical protein